MTAKPHPDRTRRSAADRLTQALATLTDADGEGRTPQSATVAELCRRARVSRNSLYRYHTAILKALRQHQCRRRPSPESTARSSTQQLRTENASLRDSLDKLAALADHYYAAHREASTLLARRERELAELRRALHLKPAVLKH